MRVFGWLMMACVALAAPATAQDKGAAACEALSSPAAQSGCLEKLYDAADAKLNKIYQRAMASVDKSDSDHIADWKAELKKSEQTWIAFRDTDCGALVGYEWGHGTGMGSAMQSCLLDKTEQRTRELTARYIDRR
jgi:uncharacterized protein YecT (DUF1311 family)